MSFSSFHILRAQQGLEVDGGMIDHNNASAVLSKNAITLEIQPAGITLPVTGAGTRMMWIPGKSAYRVGTVNGTQWDAANLGTWSFSSGFNTIASGNYSSSLGEATTASGIRSLATGYLTKATGQSSSAFGASTLASGSFSTAMGAVSIASGLASMAIGDHNKSSGDASTAMGNYTVAQSFASVAMGQYNDSISVSSKNSWVLTDPLLTIGNGTSNVARSNAVTVYKNGNTDISGFSRLGKSSEGAPRIKTKKLTSTTASASNGSEPIPHLIADPNKILSVSTLVEWTPGSFAPPEYSPSTDLRYNYYISGANIVIQNNATGACLICSKSVKVMITYEE